MKSPGPIPRRESIRFLLVAFGVGMGLQLPALLIGREWFGLGLLVMWAPAIAVLVAGPVLRKRARVGLSRPWPWKWLLLAAALGTAQKLAGLLLRWALGAPVGSERLVVEGSRVIQTDLVWFFPEGGEHALVFVLHLAAMQVVGALLFAPLIGLGEELGWRTVLQPELERRLPLVRATLSSA